MLNQLRVEFYKVRKFPLLYIAVLLMFAAGFFYGYLKLPNVFLNTDQVFSDAVCDTSLLFLISVVAAWLIGADFGNRTITNELKLGYSRLSVVLTRAAAVYAVSILLHLVYIASTIGGFSVVQGFDTSVFSIANAAWIITVAFQLLAMESGTVMICFAAQKPLGAISVSVIYTFVFCNILRNYVNSRIFTLSCFCFARSSNTQWLLACAVYAFVCFAVFATVTALIFHKAEVK